MHKRSLVSRYALVGMVATLFSTVTPLAQSVESLTTTFAGGNGQDGNMFDIAATGSAAINITGFAQNFGLSGAVSGYQLWVAAGGVAGNTNNPSAWTLVASTGGFTANATGTPTTLPFSSPLSIRLTPGSRIGIYLTATGGGIGNEYTNGTNVGNVASSNGKLTIYEGYGKAYVVDFSGSNFSPRIWNGIVYYVTGPSAADTLSSMQGNSHSLRSIFSLQGAYLNPGLSYDCSVFDKNGVCVAASGRYTNVNGNSGTEVFSGVLTGAYRVNPNIRIGGFIEQYASDINTGGVNVTNTNPDFGIFGVWSQNESGEGLRFRAAYRYGEHNIRITRDAIGDAEPGTGESNLRTQGAQFTVSNGFALNNSMLLSPYAGVRYVSISRGGYTETATATVTTPLTYGKLRQETSSALLGVNLAAKLNPELTVNGTVGLEHDISQQIGNYAATGVAGLGAINFSDDTRKTRMVASAGVAYKLDPTQQISAQVFYREEAYGSTSTTTGMVTYSIGF